MSEKTSSPTSFFHKINRFLHTPMGMGLGAVLFSVCITGAVYLITSRHFMLLAANILQNPTMLLLNILPVFLFLLTIFFLSDRFLFAAGLTAEIFIFFAIADRVKTAMRQEPLLPTDLTLAKEAASIFKTFPLSTILLIGVMLVFFLLVLILTLCLPKQKLPLGKARLAGLLAVLLCGFGANHIFYADKARYNGYPTIENPYFLVNQYNSKGMIYSFLHQFNITKLKAPEGYSPALYAQLEGEPTLSANGKYPHIIMIMGEAFSDLSENPHLDFTDYRNPLENFNGLCADENAVSGHIAVAHFGGGTSDTEYDVLTGCSSRYLDNPLPSYNFIHRAHDALPRRLGKIGYDTLFLHPGYAWFYNRQNVYPYLGFETCYFLEDSFDLAKQGYGGYINETAAMDKIIETLDTHIKEKDTPLFSFTVTIQNHGPYEKKYGSLPENFATDVPLSDTERDLLTQYFKGVSDGDEQLGRLWDYAAASDDPIVLVYFGDHLPGFSNGMDFFDLLDYPIDANGTPQEQLAVYETPYLIWQNDSAKALCDIRQRVQTTALPENGLISSQFLGAMLTELLGMEGLSPLFDANNALRKELPVCTNSVYVDKNGNYRTEISEAQQKTIDTLKGWQYYKLFDERIS